MLLSEMGRKHVVPAIVIAIAACKPKVELPAEQLGCTDERIDTQGCRFAVVPPLQLVPELSREKGIRTSRWEPDGVLVVNDGHTDARIQLVEAAQTDSALDDAKILLPGESAMLRLPRGDSGSATGEQTGFLLTSDAPVSAVLYAPYRSFVGNDSGLLLPSNAWGTTYVVASYSPHAVQFQGLGEPTFFDIFTLEDGVTVRWKPLLTTTAAGEEAGEVRPGDWSSMVALQPGAPFRVVAQHNPDNPFDADVSGTWVEASGPVFVQAGSRCSAVPIETEPVSGCDPLFEPLPPVSSWGSRYALAHPPLRTREAHHYRVFSGADQLALTIAVDGEVEQDSLTGRGSFIDLVVDHGANVTVTADGPFLPVGYLETRDSDPTVQLGDPAMYTIVPPERFLPRQVISTGLEWSTHWLQVVRERSDDPLLVDGEPVTGWESFGDFQTLDLQVAEGVHELESATPFGLTQFGWTNEVRDACIPFAAQGTCQTSYAHPAGFGVLPR